MFARFIGKRGVGQISPFEFIVIIIVSSAAGDPMFYAHVPLLHGVLVLTVVMLLHRLVSILTDRSERAEDVVEGEPVLIVDDGATPRTRRARIGFVFRGRRPRTLNARRTGGKLAMVDLIFLLLIAEAAAHALGGYSSVADGTIMHCATLLRDDATRRGRGAWRSLRCS